MNCLRLQKSILRTNGQLWLVILILLSSGLLHAQQSTVTDEERQGFKAFSNRLRNSGTGVLITPGAGRGAPEARVAKAYLQGILDNLGKSVTAAQGIHVVVNVYSSLSMNAFANQPRAPENNPTTLHRYLGVAPDGKPIYEIGVNQGAFSFFKSEDEIAFVLGHEFSHITQEHVKIPEGHQGIAEKWYSSQANEVEADLTALKYMRGKYNLDAAMAIMERLSPREADGSAYRQFSENHHHPSVRLSAMLAQIQNLRRTDPDAVPIEETEIPRDRLKARQTDRSTYATDNIAEYRKEYFQWLDQFMGKQSQTNPTDINAIWPKDKYPNLAGTNPYPGETRSLFRDSLEHIKMLPISSQEKIERIFELLMIYDHKLYSKTGNMISEPSLRFLGQNERKALDSTLKELSIGKANPWTTDGVIAEVQKRLKLWNSWEGRNMPTSEMIGRVTSSGSTAPVFQKYAKVSSQWQDLINRPYQVSNSSTIDDFRSVLSSATQKPLPEAAKQNVLRTLDTFPYADVYHHDDGLDRIQGFYSLQKDAEKSKCKDLDICKKIIQTLQRLEPDFKQRLLARMDQILKMNPTRLNADDLAKTTFDLKNLLSHDPFRKGLDTPDLISRAPKIWDWYQKAAANAPKGDIRTSRVFDELKSRIAEPVAASLSHRELWSPEKAREVYHQIATKDWLRADDTYLRTLSPAELKGMLLAPRKNPLDDPNFVRDLSTVTTISPDEIRRLGLSDALLDRMRSGRTTDQLSDHVEKEKEAVNRLQDLERKSYSPNHFMQGNMLRTPAVAEQVVPTLSVEELARSASQTRAASDEQGVLDLIKYPHLLDQKIDSRLTAKTYSSDTDLFVDALIAKQKQGISLAQWNKIFMDLMKGRSVDPATMPLSKRAALGSYLDKELGKLPPGERMTYLTNEKALAVLAPERAAAHLTDAYVVSLPKNADLKVKAAQFQDLQKELDLKNRFPDLNRSLERSVAHKINLQPGELKTFYADTTSIHSLVTATAVRGASGIVSRVQQLPVNEQMEFIDYVTGRRSTPPPSVDMIGREVANEIGQSPSFGDLVSQMRGRMADATDMERSLAILPFYTGPSSILGHDKGESILLEEVLKVVSPQNRDLARELANGILQAEGRNKSAAFAMIFGIKGQGGKPLTEGEILRGLFSAYGVPGVKFGQYLAFTSDMAPVRAALSELQDRALPISYLEAIRDLEKRFPNGLPDGLRIIDIKGSGSVNIGIEYFNPKTGKNEVMTVPREGVEVGANEDFRRLKNVITKLTATPSGAKRYGFTVGLIDTIKKSVQLEFNRQQVFDNQKELSQIVNRKTNGWNVRMVAPLSLDNGVLRQEKAQGTPARAVEEADPTTYRSAMTAASDVVTDHLLREDKSDKKGFNFYADSDFHNGQVFIDKSAKTVWLIDPGQSIAIDRDQYEVGKTIVRLLSGTIDIDSAVQALNNSVLNPKPGTTLFKREDLAPFLNSPDSGDAFIKFISMVKRVGGEVPLPTVQWVFGMNRQVALRRNLGQPLDARLVRRFTRDTLVSAAKGGGASHCGKDLVAILKKLASAAKLSP